MFRSFTANTVIGDKSAHLELRVQHCTGSRHSWFAGLQLTVSGGDSTFAPYGPGGGVTRGIEDTCEIGPIQLIIRLVRGRDRLVKVRQSNCSC